MAITNPLRSNSSRQSGRTMLGCDPAPVASTGAEEFADVRPFCACKGANPTAVRQHHIPARNRAFLQSFLPPNSIGNVSLVAVTTAPCDCFLINSLSMHRDCHPLSANTERTGRAISGEKRLATPARLGNRYSRTQPPSFTSVWPVMNCASSDVRKDITFAMSTGCPGR